MIDLIKLTPKTYSEQSRGYQLLSRLSSAVYNFANMYADGMHIWENDIDNKLSELRARTLNLVTKYQWDLDDLEALSTNFKHLKSLKGTKKALIDSLNILLKSEHLNTSVSNNNVIFDEDKGLITIILEKRLSSESVLEDLVRLFVPFGLEYRIIYDDYEKVSGSWSDDVYISDVTSLKEIQKFIGSDIAYVVGHPRKTFDEFGNPIKDSEGNFVPAVDEYGNPLYDDYITTTLVGADTGSTESVLGMYEYTEKSGQKYIYHTYYSDDIKSNDRFITKTYVQNEDEINEATPTSRSASNIVGAWKEMPQQIKTKIVKGDKN